MHPHIQTWGSMLRLYGSKLEESFLKMENERTEDSNEKEEDKQSTTESLTNKHQKAKPNLELLEKLKEEMRKLKKNTPTGQGNLVGDENQKDTLLTIPPLLLGDSEFKFSSANYLMTSKESNQNKDEENEKKDDGIIMVKMDNAQVENSNKKRKMNSDFENESEDSENSDEESEDEEDSDNDSDSDLNNSFDSNSQSD